VACFKPIKGYRAPSGRVTFDRKNSTGALAEVPCGQCIGCRLDYAQSWAIRCLHEASLHDENSFLTLTYDDENLPRHGSLQPKHFTDFMKRFRKEIEPDKIKYYMCGEYGADSGRPHYHALIFGYSFPDKRLWSYSEGKNPDYRSTQLERLWPHGFNLISAVDYKSAGYVARYTIKKLRGAALEKRDPDTDLLPYERIDVQTGEIVTIEPEYGRMSRGGNVKGSHGLGYDWYQQFKDDVFPDDFCIHKGKKVKTSKYYRNLLEAENPDMANALREKRIGAAAKHKDNQTRERLEVREKVKLAQIATLTRGL